MTDAIMGYAVMLQYDNKPEIKILVVFDGRRAAETLWRVLRSLAHPDEKFFVQETVIMISKQEE